MKKKLLIIGGAVVLCALAIIGIMSLSALAGIVILWVLGVAALVSYFLKRSKVDPFQKETPTIEIIRKEGELNDLAVYLQKIREEEKFSLSRELHDELGQLLTALRMDIAWLDRGIPHDRPNLRHKINDMISVIERTIKIVQKICTDLRPSILDDLGLVPALQWQAKDFEKYARVPVTMEIQKEDIPMDQEEATIFFRVFQEALINIARYARATRVYVSLKTVNGTLVLKIRDNGIGIEPEKVEDPHSFGIMGMRQRLLSRGGKLLIKGEKNRGTTIEASLSLGRKEAAYEDPHR